MPRPATPKNHAPKPRALVSGALANKPFNGGNAWTRLSWIRGLQQLGYEVCFVELLHPTNCVDERKKSVPFRESSSARYFRNIMNQFELSECSALLLDDGRETIGCSMSQLQAWADQSDLIINIGGHLTLPDIRDRVRCRIYFDDDPGYTQFWQAMGSDPTELSAHDFFYTLGYNIGQADCPIPTQGIPWRPILPPVVLEDWTATPKADLDRFSTIASWRGSYGPIYYNGVRYGLKAHEFRKFWELPRRSPHPFEIALQIHPADEKDRQALLNHRWKISDALEATQYPTDFRDYVQSSAAEFSVAQGIYVQTNSGWFSDRTVRYLTSGRPALVQDTGFSSHLPVGLGLCAFRTIDEAVSLADSIARDYEQHAQRARELAEEFFDAGKVIAKVLNETTCGTDRPTTAGAHGSKGATRQ